LGEKNDNTGNNTNVKNNAGSTDLRAESLRISCNLVCSQLCEHRTCCNYNFNHNAGFFFCGGWMCMWSTLLSLGQLFIYFHY